MNSNDKCKMYQFYLNPKRINVHCPDKVYLNNFNKSVLGGFQKNINRYTQELSTQTELFFLKVSWVHNVELL